MNTIKEETQIKSISETKLELIEWILALNNVEVINYLIKQREEIEEAEKQNRFLELFGAWESEQTGDELVKEIYDARMDTPREIEL
ncbi:hypothetical protein [Bernardetia sp. MNP-M8]|uniref:hypothetical protein n=1 Tax=Bernardetia sp. MNP-M8 TaxID=3127470 RepID=UPI0030D2BB5F